MKTLHKALWTSAALVGLALVLTPAPAAADICHLDDVIIDGSLCVGFDCVCNMSFGFDTIVLQENNLRIFFNDTSTASSFPRNDWRIRINDSANGGGSYFAVEDSTAGATPFRVDAGARNNALYVDSQGDIGIGTSAPSVDVHIKTGNTPTLRLDQDGTSGFTPQVWDVAGNETNFFVRDVTHGSALPFRIRPDAPTSSIFVDTDGDVGLSDASPDAPLDVTRTDAADRIMLQLENNGASRFSLIDSGGGDWEIGPIARDGNFIFNSLAAAGSEITINPSGDVGFLAGTVSVSNLGAAGAEDLCRNASNQIATCSSSVRYKAGVESLDAGSAVVERLRPVEFQWKDSDDRDLGFIAEEVAAIDPLLVTYNAKGEIEGVKYKQLTAVLVNALQEQGAELDLREAQLKALLERVDRLEKMID